MIDEETRARLEAATDAAVADAVRSFLAQIQRWVRREFASVATLPVPASEAAAPGSLIAATVAPPDTPLPPGAIDVFRPGQARGWWAEALDAAGVDSTLTAAWVAGWEDLDQAIAVQPTVAAEYLGRVADRLSTSALPTVPDDALDTIRATLATATSDGWSIRDTADRVAVEFSWSPRGDYWRSERARADAALDALLDPYGPPGSPAREAARLGGDPAVETWQRRKADATLALDRDASVWQTRAERIARTETTGAVNAGSLASAQTGGFAVKVWLATGGPRTRDSHLEASGQCVPIDSTFTVGGSELLIPGDPAGPADEVVNCRCTVLYERSCQDAADRYGAALSTVEAEARDRGLDGL